MLAIRLQRTGRKHEPTFRVVLTDSKNGPKSGKYLENLGWFDARIDNKIDQLNTEKIKYWIGKGAKTSVTLHNFLVEKKIVSGKKLNALPKKTPPKKEEAPTEEVKSTVASSAPAETPTQTNETSATSETPAETASA